MKEKEIISHGITYIRTGECNLCGGCDHECSNCPHGKEVDGKWICEIYDTRGQVCDYCTNNSKSSWYRKGRPVTHKVCVDFPDHPLLTVIKSGKCAYKFRRKNAATNLE